MAARSSSMSPPVDGVVLAAGRSSRIGRPKPLLRVRGGSEPAPLPSASAKRDDGSVPLTPADGGRVGASCNETFLERAVRRLAAAGCRSVTVVVAVGDDPVRRHARALGAVVVENAEPDSQPIDSVRLAISRLPTDSAAALVLPVDVPLVTTETVATVIEAFAARQAPIVAPSYRGELGHPVLIARPLFHSVMTESLEQGLHSLIESRADDIEAVRVDDPGTVIDIDTDEDYDKRVVRGDLETR